MSHTLRAPPRHLLKDKEFAIDFTYDMKKMLLTAVTLKPNSITLVGSEMVRSWFEPDSVIEFGF